jgi:hypothetical protein
MSEWECEVGERGAMTEDRVRRLAMKKKDEWSDGLGGGTVAMSGSSSMGGRCCQ